MIYLDNAATSFPKPRSVIRETNECIKKYCANSGRSSHKLAIKTGEEIYRTREAISNFLNTENPERVCFTLNATYALNTAIKTLITSPCHVLISDVEHNSVLRPLNKLRSTIGITYSPFSTDGNIEENIENSITTNTKAIVCALASNVTGEEIDIEILSRVAKRHSLTFIADASQLIGHKIIDLKKTPCDALCAPGHKALFGIQGCGFTVFGSSDISGTIIEGGSGNDSRNKNMPGNLPEHFEAGTLPTPSIVALRSGIDYINKKGLTNIESKLNHLTNLYRERLLSIPNVILYGCKNGIISFKITNKSASYIASKLNDRGIFTRSGLHCAPMTHIKLKTENGGLVRVSLSALSKEADADSFYLALKYISEF